MSLLEVVAKQEKSKDEISLGYGATLYFDLKVYMTVEITLPETFFMSQMKARIDKLVEEYNPYITEYLFDVLDGITNPFYYDHMIVRLQQDKIRDFLIDLAKLFNTYGKDIHKESIKYRRDNYITRQTNLIENVEFDNSSGYIIGGPRRMKFIITKYEESTYDLFVIYNGFDLTAQELDALATIKANSGDSDELAYNAPLCLFRSDFQNTYETIEAFRVDSKGIREILPTIINI